MALDDSALLEMIEMLRTADGGELMRRLLGGMLQAVVDAEATARIGAGPHERSEARTTQRNGTRDKLVTTAVGDLTVRRPYRPNDGPSRERGGQSLPGTSWITSSAAASTLSRV